MHMTRNNSITKIVVTSFNSYIIAVWILAPLKIFTYLPFSSYYALISPFGLLIFSNDPKIKAESSKCLDFL